MAEHVLLIGVSLPSQPLEEVKENLNELKLLVRTLRYEIADSLIMHRERVNPSTFIGKGKVSEIQNVISILKINEVVFDNELTPTQIRNLQNMIKVEVQDRTGIILQIFASHAKTKEAKTQIELAALQYLLPRLTRRWTHLERQIGGIGVRGGAGETQIETDRRLIRNRIAKLGKELRRIDKEREVQRKGRNRFFKAAIVGYTNAGKSTLMNALTDSNVSVEDELFATLDTTVRLCKLDKYHKLILSDTVGFIKKLPHHLIASFRSTLGEVNEADLIIRITDISSNQCINQLNVVNEVLIQLGVHRKPYLIVFNKIDKMKEGVFKHIRYNYPNAIFLSALQHLRIDELRKAILNVMERQEVLFKLRLPINDVAQLAILRDNTFIKSEEFSDSQVCIELSSYREVWNWLKSRLTESIEIEEM